MKIREGLRRAGGGATAMWQAVGKTAKNVAQGLTPNPGPIDTTEASLAQPAPEPPQYTLPDLGPEPTLNDAAYQGDNVPAGKFEEDLANYKHKQEIHSAMKELDDIYRQAHPERDFQGEYHQELAAMGADPGYTGTGGLLKRFALALGDFNPAAKTSNLAAADAKQAEYDTKKRDLLRRMTEAKMADAESKGNWAMALKQHEQQRLMDLEDTQTAHQNKMAEEANRQSFITERANAQNAMKKEVASMVAAGGGKRTPESEKMAELILKAYLSSNYGKTGIMDTQRPMSTDDINTMFDAMHNIREAVSKENTGHRTPPPASNEASTDNGFRPPPGMAAPAAAPGGLNKPPAPKQKKSFHMR